MMTHKELVRKMLKDPAVKAEYDALAEEFALLDELLKARHRAGLTQAQVAARMGTKTPAVARLEAGGGNLRHSPSIATLRKYAEAVGCQLQIRMQPRKRRNIQALLDKSRRQIEKTGGIPHDVIWREVRAEGGKEAEKAARSRHRVKRRA
jgi:transcriptional regulator with XRE-family HTH domain